MSEIKQNYCNFIKSFILASGNQRDEKIFNFRRNVYDVIEFSLFPGFGCVGSSAFLKIEITKFKFYC